MWKWGLLDVAIPTPTEVVFEMGGWIPLLIAVLIIGGLIFVFVRNNRDKKILEEWEQEQDKKEEK